ncbi:hypothetical protein ANCDUO_01068 [Ancylostoma duodenale]|uniref:Uncharacterized protein n=1 Tax=Ancylostoma duodenale TaxID=51022 RepID=A0A0C2HAC3_9BILA|nr:hypothetical protein ANCDUO_01068 [Ancylostoma duodenale]
MKRAADFILDTTRCGTFSQASYDEFVRSELAGRAAFCFDGLNDFDNPATGEIRQARNQQNIRNADFSERGLPEGEPVVSLQNCEKNWCIEESPPFIKLDLTLVAEDWQPRKKDNTSQQLASLFRYLLIRVSSPFPVIIE